MSVIPSPIVELLGTFRETPTSLLEGSPLDVKTLSFAWADKDNKRGSWKTQSGNTALISIVGVVNGSLSKVGAYGNLYKQSTSTVTLAELKRAKFTVVVTLPDALEGDANVELIDALKEQFVKLHDIFDMNEERLGPSERPNVWVKFVDDAVDGDEDGITRGNISASLGPVYKSASRASDVTKFKKSSPVKAKPKLDDSVLAATTRARVAHDPENYVALLPGLEPSALSDNADIPVYDLAGKRITDSADLAKELYDGRWIKMDAELQLWQYSDKPEGARTYQLVVKRLVIFPEFKARIPGPYVPSGQGEFKAPTGPEGERDVGDTEAEANSEASTVSAGENSPSTGGKRSAPAAPEKRAPKRSKAA